MTGRLLFMVALSLAALTSRRTMAAEPSFCRNMPARRWSRCTGHYKIRTVALPCEGHAGRRNSRSITNGAWALRPMRSTARRKRGRIISGAVDRARSVLVGQSLASCSDAFDAGRIKPSGAFA